MKRAIAMLSLLALSVAGSALADVKTGDAAPAFSLKDVNGHDVSLADFHGKFVILEWANPSCPFVKKFYEPGEMQRLQKEAEAKGAVWLTINSTNPKDSAYQTPEQARAWAAEHHVASTWLLDPEGKVGKEYGARNTPHMFIINPEGKVIYQGAIDSIDSAKSEDIKKAQNYVMEALTAAKAGQPVANGQTRPYGCTVKYGS